MHAMRSMLDGVVLNQSDDRPWWMKNKNANFTLKTLYDKLSDAGPDRSFKHVWKSKLQSKI